MGRLRIAAFAAATLALCSFAVCGSVSGTRRGRGADHLGRLVDFSSPAGSPGGRAVVTDRRERRRLRGQKHG